LEHGFCPNNSRGKKKALVANNSPEETLQEDYEKD